jgi:hypothetical protein
LELKFGSEGLEILPEISEIQDVEQLRAILQAEKGEYTLTVASVVPANDFRRK